MENYYEGKIAIRPIIDHLVIDNTMSSDVQFQNASLRPILKMQHAVIVSMVKEYLKMKKNTFYNLSKEQKPDYLKNNLLSDSKIVHELKGIVLGQFTTEEITYYLKNKASLNKRIQALLLQRISSFLF